MILWTIQPKAVADLIETTGRFVCDGRRTDRDFKHAYRWMAEQMVKRGIQKNPKFPVWAWFRFNPLGRYARGPRITECQETCPLNEPFCRIKFDAPANLVLLSDFSLWHAVLNGMYLGSEEEEKQDIKTAVKQTPEEFINYKNRSWERIFDLDLKRFNSKMPDWNSGGSLITIQACLPYLLSEWVLQIDHFTTRRRSAYYRKKWGALADEPGFGRGKARKSLT